MMRNLLTWLRPRPGPLRRALLALALLVSATGLAFVFPGSRLALLRVAERVGLFKEEEHRLVPVKDEKGQIKYWTCTMHPSVRAAGPGKCPI